MINKKLLVTVAGLILAVSLAGCGAASDKNDTPASDNKAESEVTVTTSLDKDDDAADKDTESDDAPGKADNSDNDTENNAPSDEDDTSNDDIHSASLSLAQDFGPDGTAVFEVIDYIYITPEDTELIQKYNFPEDLDGYDYEVVQSEDGPQILLAFEDCKIEIIEWDKGETEYKTISLEEFCNYLKNKNGSTTVLYKKDDLDTITYICEDYAG